MNSAIAQKLKTALASRDNFHDECIDPSISVNNNTPLGMGYLLLRKILPANTQSALQILQTSRLSNTVVGEALSLEAATHNFKLTEAFYPLSALRVLNSPDLFSRCLKRSVLRGDILNALTLCRESLMSFNPIVDDKEVIHKLSEEIRHMQSYPDLRPDDHKFLYLLQHFISAGGEFSISPGESLKVPHEKLEDAYQQFSDKVRETFGIRSAEILKSVTGIAYTNHTEEIERLLSLVQDRAPQLLCCLNQIGMVERIGEVIALLKKWGPEAWGFYRAYGVNASSMSDAYEATFLRLHRALEQSECDDEFGEAVGLLDTSYLVDFPAHVATIIEHAGSYSRQALAGVNSLLLEVLTPEALGALCKFSHEYAEATLLRVNDLRQTLGIAKSGADAAELNQFIMEVAPHLNRAMPKFFEKIPLELYENERKALVTFVQQQGKIAPALLEQFEKLTLLLSPTLEAEIRFAKKLFGDGAADYLSRSPPEQWSEERQRFHFKRLGKYAGRFAESTLERLETTTGEPLTALFEKNRIEFGLRSFHRYTSVREGIVDTSLLSENLANLNPQCRTDLPVALVVFGSACHNDALGQQFANLRKIAATYKLFIAEVQSPRQFLQAIMKVGAIHGIDKSGFALKPVDLLIVHAHGYRSFTAFDEFGSMKHVDRSLDGPILLPEHLAALSESSKALSQSGLLISGSCESAFGGAEAENPLRLLKKATGMSTVEGSRKSTYLLKMNYDGRGMVTGGRFGCSTRKVVRL